ncbi:Integrase catalytic domain-containing protein [Citrus sinensis]|nr:Integrase catalytic domain-containing protein [Citrus sinensis]
MFDGIVRELKELRFIPVLKKNLISVGALEIKGYKVIIEDGIMKFTHGAMVILRVWVYTMRVKDEVLEIFVKWNKLVETQIGRKIKVLRSNNEGEYTSDPFLQVYQNEGIKRHFTVRHTPQHNGVAERMNRTLLEKVRCMLSNAGLDKKFWAEAVSYASHLINRLPSAAIRGKTPMEMWSGKHAQNYDSLRIFGCPTYYHVKYGKLDHRARKAIFMGFKCGVKGFKLWDLEDKKPRREIRKLGWLTKDMVVAYALSVIDDDISNTFVAEYESELTQLDVKTAFLHADLEEEIYMIQPCGFRVAGKENHVSSKNKDEIERLKKQLASEFEMKYLGDVQRILGREIRKDKKNGSVWLTQKSYLKKVLERFGIDDKTKPVCTPLTPHFKLSSFSCPISQEKRDYMTHVSYASVVGSLMYVMVCIRPDISLAVSMVSRYMHNPGKNQWLTVKWILRYLYGIVDVGLLFKKDCGQQCVGYCDSDFAGDFDKRRSTMGYVLTLGGGPVSWRSILQSTIALSTTEAEYMAATETVKEAIWLKGLLGDLRVI